MPHFKILAFPCNQFGLEEPGHNNEIMNEITYVRPGGGFVPKFNVTIKVNVNGNESIPLFFFLRVSSIILWNQQSLVVIVKFTTVKLK